MAACEIVENRCIRGDYWKVVFNAPDIAMQARPGQFVHIRIDRRGDHILRRPFSICDTVPGGLVTVVYKVVGFGTKMLSRLRPQDVFDVMGPLGRGFSDPAQDVIPVLIDGGYGAAATFMLSKRARNKGYFLLGARTGGDILLSSEYAANGFEVRIATNDGSVGTRGFVTDLIEPLLRENPGKKFFFYGCGPHPMLMALAEKLRALKLDGELSIDSIMCCGIGACFGCVVKVISAESPSGWRYARSCAEGPVFPLKSVFVER